MKVREYNYLLSIRFRLGEGDADIEGDTGPAPEASEIADITRERLRAGEKPYPFSSGGFDLVFLAYDHALIRAMLAKLNFDAAKKLAMFRGERWHRAEVVMAMLLGFGAGAAGTLVVCWLRGVKLL